MCDRMLGTYRPPSTLVDKEWETDTETGREKLSACFQFCKHCIAQLDSVLAANSVSTCLPPAFTEAIQNSIQASTEVFGSGPIPSQECTESNNKFLMFLKLVSEAFSANTLTKTSETKVDSTTSDASLHKDEVSTATNPIGIAYYSVTQQIGEETICDVNFTYRSDDIVNKIEAGVEMEASRPLSPATFTSSIPKALLHCEDYNTYDNTTTYTLEDLFPEPEERSYIFPNYKSETGNATASATATAPAADTGAVIGQPSSILPLEQHGPANSIEGIDGRKSNQNLCCYDPDLPFHGQEVEISLSGPTSALQSQLPPMSLENLVQQIGKSRKQELASSTEKPPKTLIVIRPMSAKVTDVHRKREKNPNNEAIPHVVVTHNPPQNQTYSCKRCTFQFCSKYLLNKHTKIQHKDAAYACKFCNQRYYRANELREHKVKCAFLKTKKIHTCKICSKQYLWKESMKRHERAHSGIKSHTCDKCGHSYYEKYDLMRHHKRFANRNTCVGAVRGKKTNSTSRVSNGAATVVDSTSMSTVEMAVAPSEAISVQSSSPNRERKTNAEVKFVGPSM